MFSVHCSAMEINCHRIFCQNNVRADVGCYSVKSISNRGNTFPSFASSRQPITAVPPIDCFRKRYPPSLITVHKLYTLSGERYTKRNWTKSYNIRRSIFYCNLKGVKNRNFKSDLEINTGVIYVEGLTVLKIGTKFGYWSGKYGHFTRSILEKKNIIYRLKNKNKKMI